MAVIDLWTGSRDILPWKFPSQEPCTPRTCAGSREVWSREVRADSDDSVRARDHACVLGVLVLAAVLAIVFPDEILRIHYQCMLKRLTGLDCPFCGMSRDFISLAGGQWPSRNPASLPLAVALYVFYPIGLAVRGCMHGSVAVPRKVVRVILLLACAVLFVTQNV